MNLHQYSDAFRELVNECDFFVDFGKKSIFVVLNF